MKDKMTMRKKRRRKVKGSKKGHRGKKETEDPLRTGTKMETNKNKKRTNTRLKSKVFSLETLVKNFDLKSPREKIQ